jgi:phage recombination protein Bet
MTTQLKDLPEDKVSVEYEVDGSKIKLTPSIVQNYIVGSDNKITDQEYKFFVELCKVRKLNPFTKEVYLIKYDSKQPAQIVVGKDAILKRAILNKNFNGRQQGIIVLRDEEVKELNGTFKLKDDVLVGGWAKVYRKDWEHPVYITVSFDEAKQEKSVYKDSKFVGKELNNQWATKGATMIEKVALVRALREAFVEDLGGMVDEDEVWNKEEPRQSTTQIKVQKDVLDVEVVEQGQEISLKDLE